MDKARIWLRLLFLLFAILRFASAQPPVQQPAPPSSASTPEALPKGWLKAASLRPGDPLSVQVRATRAPTLCTLVWIDNNALACDSEDGFGASRRVIYPAAQVFSVKRDKSADCEQDCGEVKRMLIGVGVGALVGGLVLGQTSGQAGAVGAMLGAGFGGSLAAGPQLLGAPTRPAMSMRIPVRRPSRLRYP